MSSTAAKYNFQTPKPGEIVRVRSRRYLVENVEAPPDMGHATLVAMACLDDDAQGQPLEVLWEKEIDREVLTGEVWQDLSTRGFDPPRLFSAYLHTMRWNCVTATDPNLFQSPFRAGIQIHAYQLEPLRKALRLPRVNLFIADDVGLGKTIEAGLIAREMLLRKRVKEIVVACPPSMLYQWKDELETRFGLTFEILDKAYISKIRQERGYSVNPWTTHTRFLISQRLLIDDAYTVPMRDWLGDLRPGSLLILDEAHNVAPASGARYAIDSKITRAVRSLAPCFEHRLFLSATPHNGHSNSFSALLEILDPQRFCRGVPVRNKKLLEDVMVRRIKEDIRTLEGGLPKRVVRQIDIDGLPIDTPELQLSVLLDSYRNLRRERLQHESKRKQASAELLICGLQQRLLSSIEAFFRTLRVHRKTVLRQWEAAKASDESTTPDESTPSDTNKYDLLTAGIDSDDDRATLSEEELQAEEDALVEAATRESTGPLQGEDAESMFAREQQLLEEMNEIADTARFYPDARVKHLVDWIRANMCPGLPPMGQEHGQPPENPDGAADWNDTRLIIFTEYDDTKRYLVDQLNSAIAFTRQANRRIAVYHGPTPPAKREELKRAFNTDPRKNPLRILIATDAAREGLNLQSHCYNLFHFDLPWNPSRMEQRNGRIDRKLQPQPEVYCHYFVYKQRTEDRILSVLVRKTDTIKKELGSLSKVIEVNLANTLKRGIRHGDIEQLEKEILEADIEKSHKRTVEEELEVTRERQEGLKSQIDLLRNRIDDSKKWLGLKEDHFRDAISCSLELMNAPPLKTIRDTETSEHPLVRYTLPDMTQRAGADPTWADTMDTLRTPRKRDQKSWDWRREAEIRPIVFEAPDTMDEDVVHLHLEHRLVQRLLGRFMSQGFIHHDLSRACLAQTKDAIPRVLLLGRLCLYGPGAARLHEEIIPITARWREISQREGALKPYAIDAETKTLDLLEEALLPQNSQELSAVVQEKLQQSGPKDVQELLPHLQARGEQYAEIATAKLLERGRKEAQAMVEILQSQKKRVTETAARYAAENFQLEFDFNEEETRQLEANKRHWQKRLAAIDLELSTEPQRIQELYQVKAQRVEPVGLVYLWPITG